MTVSNARLMSPSSAAEYYRAERSHWSGRLADVLGLKGPINLEVFAHLLHGRSPTGVTLINKSGLHQQQKNAEAIGKSAPKERAGFDVVTSTPKAISLETCIFGNSQLEAAHSKATAQMLSVMEDRYAMTRIAQHGKRPRILTGELLIASFEHFTSQNHDPHRHTHNFVFNLQRNPITQRWQSLENQAIYDAIATLKRIYSNTLAYEVQRSGYEIRMKKDRPGLWELEGYSEAQLRHFSSRSGEIIDLVGVDASAQLRDWAQRVTREPKVELEPDVLERHWIERAIATNLTPIEPQIVPDHQTEMQQIIQLQLMQWMIECLHHNPKIRRDELERQAMMPPGQFSFDDIERSLCALFPHGKVYVSPFGALDYAVQKITDHPAPIVQSAANDATAAASDRHWSSPTESESSTHSASNSAERSDFDQTNHSITFAADSPSDFTGNCRYPHADSERGDTGAGSGISAASSGSSVGHDRAIEITGGSEHRSEDAWDTLRCDLENMERVFADYHTRREAETDRADADRHSSRTDRTANSPEKAEVEISELDK